MALIKCPECGKEISDKASVCINCGYPINTINNNILYDAIYIGFSSKNAKNSNEYNVIGQIKHILNLENISAVKKILDNPPYAIMQGINKDNAEWIKQLLLPYGCNIQIEITKSNDDNNSTLEKFHHSLLLCPKCGNPDVVTGQRGFSLMTGFIGSNKTINRCGRCGHKWEP